MKLVRSSTMKDNFLYKILIKNGDVTYIIFKYDEKENKYFFYLHLNLCTVSTVRESESEMYVWVVMGGAKKGSKLFLLIPYPISGRHKVVTKIRAFIECMYEGLFQFGKLSLFFSICIYIKYNY